MSSMATMVPIIPGIRSTPSNSSSNNNNNNATNKKREASTSSVAPVDDGSEADSMRPQAPEYYFRRNKRRRTVIDAFSSISLQKADNSDEDADSSQAIAEEVEEEYYCNSSASSLEDVDDEEIDPLTEETLLSDTEISRNAAERKVMLELVFGPDERDPVDRKLQQLVKKSIDQVAAGELPICNETKDDMSLNTIYNSTCDSDLTVARDSVHELKRSSSLPEMMGLESLTEGMETE